MMNVMEEIRSYRPIEISTNDIIIDTTSVADTRHGTSVRQLLLSSVQIELVYVSRWNTGSSYVGVDMGSIHPAHQEPVSGCTAAEARRNDVEEKGDDEDDNDWFFSHRNISEFIIYRFCLVGHLNSACLLHCWNTNAFTACNNVGVWTVAAIKCSRSAVDLAYTWSKMTHNLSGLSRPKLICLWYMQTPSLLGFIESSCYAVTAKLLIMFDTAKWFISLQTFK